MYELNRIRRPGKTAKDRASGASARNESNKRARAAYQQDAAKGAAFPKTTCNGKRNHHRGMGKCAEYYVHA